MTPSERFLRDTAAIRDAVEVAELTVGRLEVDPDGRRTAVLLSGMDAERLRGVVLALAGKYAAAMEQLAEVTGIPVGDWMVGARRAAELACEPGGPLDDR